MSNHRLKQKANMQKLENEKKASVVISSNFLEQNKQFKKPEEAKVSKSLIENQCLDLIAEEHTHNNSASVMINKSTTNQEMTDTSNQLSISMNIQLTNMKKKQDGDKKVNEEKKQ